MNRKIYPIYFIVERAKNGYVITYKKNDSTEITKEVVLEGNINARIGELLSLETLSDGRIAKFHVEAIAADNIVSTKDPANFEEMNELFAAKLCFYKFQSEKNNDGNTLALYDKDEDIIELFGDIAKEVATKHELPLAYKYDTAIISFPPTKDGKISLAQCVQRVKLIALTHKELLEWYHTNRI